MDNCMHAVDDRSGNVSGLIVAVALKGKHQPLKIADLHRAPLDQGKYDARENGRDGFLVDMFHGLAPAVSGERAKLAVAESIRPTDQSAVAV